MRTLAIGPVTRSSNAPVLSVMAFSQQLPDDGRRSAPSQVNCMIPK